MTNAYKRGLGALAALAVAAISLTVTAPVQAAAGDFTQNVAYGNVAQQTDGTYLLTAGWEYSVDVTGYAPPVTFTANVLVAQAADGSNSYGTARPVCTSTTDPTGTLATVTCDGEVTVPTALADYRVTSLLFGRDASNQLVGPEEMVYLWEDPTPDPVDPDDQVDPNPNTNNCPTVPDGPLISGCVYGVGNVPVTCLESLHRERWVPGTGTAEFKGGRKENGEKWRDKPLSVKGGHVVLTDQKFAHAPGTQGEACTDETINQAVTPFTDDANLAMDWLWFGTPPEGGFATWDGATNGYRLGNYGYAAQSTFVACKTYDGTNIIASCNEPFTGLDETEKVTLACDGPRYVDGTKDDSTGSVLYGGWTKVSPKLLTDAGCQADVPETPKPKDPKSDPDPKGPKTDDPYTGEPPRIEAGAVFPARQAATAKPVSVETVSATALVANGINTTGLFVGLFAGLS